MDFNIAFICVASIIVMFFIYLIIKETTRNRKKGEHTETTAKVNWKDGSFEIGNKVTDNIKKQNEIINNAFASPNQILELEGKSEKEVLNHYNGKNYNDRITRLLVYIEYAKIINTVTRKVQASLVSYVAYNCISEKTEAEFDAYIKQKRLEIIDRYNIELSKSSVESIKKLSLESVCNFYYVIILNMLKEMYNSIYNNHKSQAGTRVKFKTPKGLTKEEKLAKYKEFIHENIRQRDIKDAEIIDESMDYLVNFLLGLFHDIVEKEYKNYV